MLEEENDKPLHKRASNFIKYTGLAFQMLATIGIFSFIGYKIDEHYKNDNFIITAILGIVGVGASLYQVVRSLKKEK